MPVPVRDAAGAGDEHLLLVPERRRRGGASGLGCGLGVGGRLLEAEERARRALRRGVVGLLCDGGLRGRVGALPLLRHGTRRVPCGLEGAEAAANGERSLEVEGEGAGALPAGGGDEHDGELGFKLLWVGQLSRLSSGLNGPAWTSQRMQID